MKGEKSKEEKNWERLSFSLPLGIAKLLRARSKAENKSMSKIVADAIGTPETQRRIDVADDIRLIIELLEDWYCEENKVSDKVKSIESWKQVSMARFKSSELFHSIPHYLLMAAKLGNPFLQQKVPGVCYIPEVAYTGTSIELDKLIRQALQMFQQIPGAPLVFRHLGRVADGSKTFDASKVVELGLSVQVIYPFPYFLFEPRKNFFGVIEYGKQLAFGVVMHKEHPMLKEYESCFSCSVGIDTVCLSSFEESKVIERNYFIDSLLTYLIDTEPGAQVYAKSSFIIDELWPMLLSHRCLSASNPLSFYADNKIRSAQEAKDIVELFTKEEPSHAEKAGKHRDILFYDVSLHDEIIAENKLNGSGDNYRFIWLRHDLDIPVGVGYSLSVLPNLTRTVYHGGKEVSALDVISEAIQEILTEEFCVRLLGEGIFVDQRYVDTNILDNFRATPISTNPNKES